MTAEEAFRGAFVSLEVDDVFTEAVLTLRDGSRLCFRHRVGERWARAMGAGDSDDDAGLAGRLLPLIGMFRLNARHLDVDFHDGGRWEARFGDPGHAR
jgi:hypothetical protein